MFLAKTGELRHLRQNWGYWYGAVVFTSSGDGGPLGMAVTLANRQHFGNAKVMKWIWATISPTILINKGNTPKRNTPKGSTPPPHVQSSRNTRSRTQSGRSNNCTETEGKKHKRVTNCSRHCLLSNREPRNEFLSKSHHQTTSGLHTKDWDFQCLSPLAWTGRVLQSISGAFIMWLPCSTIDSLDLSTKKHKSTLTVCIKCSTPGTISSLLSIISSPAVGIKPLLAIRSATQNSGGKMPINDLTNRSVKRNRWTRWLQNECNVLLNSLYSPLHGRALAVVGRHIY